MPARKATELTDLIKKLRTIRRQHEVALDEIENTFRSFGIEHLLEASGSRKRGGAAGPGRPAKKTRGRPPAAAVQGKKTRGRPPAAAGAQAKAGKKTRGAAAAGAQAKAGKKTRGPGKAAGKAKAAEKAERRTRAKYTQTGDEFILSFLSKKGSATTNEIRQHWQKQGRRGKAENNLTGLVKTGQLVRTPTPGQAGSTYSLPNTAERPPQPEF